MAVSLGPISPFFIVSNVELAANFYCDKLGFTIIHLEPTIDPFFALVERDSVRLMLKAVSDDVLAIPNVSRHEWAPWDAYVFVHDPYALANELKDRSESTTPEVVKRDDGLIGFEVSDYDGYVLFFGRPGRKNEA